MKREQGFPRAVGELRERPAQTLDPLSGDRDLLRPGRGVRAVLSVLVARALTEPRPAAGADEVERDMPGDARHPGADGLARPHPGTTLDSPPKGLGDPILNIRMAPWHP